MDYVKKLIEQLEAKNVEVRRYAASALGRTGDEQAVNPPLTALLKDKSKRIRVAASLALGEIGGPTAFECLTESLKIEEAGVRVNTAVALGKFGTAGVSPLIAMLKDKDARVRKQSVRELERTGDSRAVAPLIATMTDSDKKTSLLVFKALEQIGAFAVEPLVEAMENLDDNLRSRVVEVLGKIGDSRAIEPLIASLKDKDSRVRSKATIALGRIGDESAIETLTIALRNEATPVRINAVHALGKYGESTLTFLIEALTDRTASVRRHIVAELEGSGDTRAIDVLKRIANEDADESVRRAAHSVLTAR